MNSAALMSTSAARDRDRTAIRQEGIPLSHAGLERATALVAGVLRSRAVEPGDRVGLMLPDVAYSRSANTARCAPVPRSCR
jgi:long-chain acyl-CoA synthetase